MTDPPDLDRELTLLERELRKLDGEYHSYFAGRLARPPWEARTRVEQLVKRRDRIAIQNHAGVSLKNGKLKFVAESLNGAR